MKCHIILSAFALTFMPLYAQQIESNTNHIQTVTYIQENGGDSLVSVQFYDTYGRPTTNAKTGLTPGYQIYTSQSYDYLGRTEKTWSVTPVYTSSFQNFGNSMMDYCSFMFHQDPMSYSSIEYDALDRPIAKTIPGLTYHNNHKYTRYGYGVNDTINIKYSVRYYGVDASGSLIESNSIYDKGTLYYKSVTNPDGNEMITFKDDRGFTILERRIVDMNNADATQNDTYYVYDDMGRLTYVLPPQCQNHPSDVDYMRKYWYRYRYDSRGNVITKQLPGCDSITYQYDIDDRLTSMQDGILRAAGKKRTYTYDNLFRLTKQQIANASGNTNGSVEIENYYDIYQRINYNGLSTSDAQFLRDIDRDGDKPGFQIACRQYATHGEILLTVYSYDDKGRTKEVRSVGHNGIKNKVIFTYDYLGRVLEQCEEYYSGQVMIFRATQENVYNSYHSQFLTKSILSVEDIHGNIRTDTIAGMGYDELGNMIVQTKAGDRIGMFYDYDKLHGRLRGITSNVGFEQQLYREDTGTHPRWDGSISAMTWKAGNDDAVHRYDYTYDRLNRLIDASYSKTYSSSDASQMTLDDIDADPLNLLPSSTDATGSYDEHITYDMNSNITSLQRNGMLNDRSYGLIDDLRITYNGNQRTNIVDIAEEALDYSGSFDFVDGASNNLEYYYDANGSLTKDKNKMIDSIEYDLHGNLRKITSYISHPTHTDARFIEYTYSADGRRLRTEHKRYVAYPGGSACLLDESYEYNGNLISKNGMPQMYVFAGGYYSFNTGGSIDNIHYYIQDYMGNNRMVVNGDGTIEQVTHYYPYGGIIADISSGQDIQNYKFEGKELDRSFGLDWFDIQSRQYDAAAPIWNAIDPLAEKNYRFGSYNFCGGNPVNFGDYNGMDGNPTTEYYTEDPDEIAKIFQTYFLLHGRTEQEEDGTTYNVKSTNMGYEIGIEIPNPNPINPIVTDFEYKNYDISYSTYLGFAHDQFDKAQKNWRELDNKSKRKLAESIYKSQWYNNSNKYKSVSNVVKNYPKYLSHAKFNLGVSTIGVNIIENIFDINTNQRIGVGNAVDIVITVLGVSGGFIGSCLSTAYFISDIIIYKMTTPPMHIRDYLNNAASIEFNTNK